LANSAAKGSQMRRIVPIVVGLAIVQMVLVGVPNSASAARLRAISCRVLVAGGQPGAPSWSGSVGRCSGKAGKSGALTLTVDFSVSQHSGTITWAKGGTTSFLWTGQNQNDITGCPASQNTAKVAINGTVTTDTTGGTAVGTAFSSTWCISGTDVSAGYFLPKKGKFKF
jgi:hypothetical protein